MANNDLKEFSKRLIEVRKRLGYMQKDFAPELDVSLSFLYQVEAARTKPGFNFFRKLIEKFNVNPKYLFTGKGKMFYDQEEKPLEKDYGEYSDRVKQLLWYIENAPLAKLAVLSFFGNYLFDHRDALKEDIENYLEAKKKKKEEDLE